MKADGGVGVEGFVEGVVGGEGVLKGDEGVGGFWWGGGCGRGEVLAVPVCPCRDVGVGNLDREEAFWGVFEDGLGSGVLLSEIGEGSVGDG